MKQHFGKYLGATLIDESQPLTAWRTWRLARDAKAIVLTGTWATKQVWAADGRATVAECVPEKRTTSTGCNVSMKPGCGCGLWAAIAISNLLKHGAIALYPTGALGRVNLWGFIHVYEFGFRAQMGRPRDLWLGNTDGRAIREELANAYQVPVDVALPIETVVHPGLLTPKKILAAANAFLAGQHATATSALRTITSTLPVPIRGRRALPRLRIPASRRRRASAPPPAPATALSPTVLLTTTTALD